MDTRTFPTFRPLPWLRNAHAQTVAAHLLFRARPLAATRLHPVILPDGDQAMLHENCPPGWPVGGPVALLLHGVCGDAGSSYVARLAAKLVRRGVRTFRMDQRGAGAALGLARRIYHAGGAADLLVALQVVAHLCPGAPITLVGYSLGGNIALKLAGEFANQLPDELRQVIAVCPPIDLTAAAAAVDKPANRIYDQFFQKDLRQLVAHLRRADPAAVPPFRTLWEFNERYLSRVWGFGSAARYYAECSAARFLPAIRLPTLILTAADDPLIPVRMFEETSFSPSTRLIITDHGGHLGFLARSTPPDPDRHWMDWRIRDRILGAPVPPCPENRIAAYLPRRQPRRVLSQRPAG